MAAKKQKSLLKLFLISLIIIVLLIVLLPHHSSKASYDKSKEKKQNTISATASNDNAAESLDTLTAELSNTQQHVQQIAKQNEALQKQNQVLSKQAQNTEDETIKTLKQDVAELKTQVQQSKSNDDAINTANSTGPISTVPDLAESQQDDHTKLTSNNFSASQSKEDKPIPYYTIPANSTGVHDYLMTALVGRIPIKGVVTDPYPFKIVFSEDTLAANGLRVPNLKKMIVSGYSEGDLNLLSVRGWVTSLTFVFNDGTISTTTSNNNDLGHFTKENALGYLSDKYGNPFIRGKLITNAPAFLAGNFALGAAQGAANAYAQAQTSNQSSILGSITTSVTGSQSKYVLGQAGVNATNQIQEWWHDREENSFDAIYVATVQEDNSLTEIAVNFSKEIDINYNPKGRKIVYENNNNTLYTRRTLD